jgi:hypothetical protein
VRPRVDDQLQAAAAASEVEAEHRRPAHGDAFCADRRAVVEKAADPAPQRARATGEHGANRRERSVFFLERRPEPEGREPALDEALAAGYQQRRVLASGIAGKGADGGVDADARNPPPADDGRALDRALRGQPAKRLRRDQLIV